MTDRFYIERPLLNLLGKTEGTAKRRGYNETLAYGAYTGGDVDLVHMTLTQIDALQTKMLAHPKNHFNSSALGMYQIVRKTLRALRSKLDLSPDALYDADLQDRLAVTLLDGRGLHAWLAGSLTDKSLVNGLAAEWASLPRYGTGTSYYGGRAAVHSDTVMGVLYEVKARAKAEPSVGPAEAEPEVQKVEPKQAGDPWWLTLLRALFKGN